MDFNLTMGSLSAEQNFKPLDDTKVYDVLILGGGPAGLTAAVYCMRKGVNTGILVKDIGGQVAETSTIENYLGFRIITGMELVEKFKEQVLQFGIDFEEGAEVVKVEDGNEKKVHLVDGRVFKSRTVIITTGKRWKRLNVPGEDKLAGRGVAYCATCDAPLYAGKKTVVVGGGNSAVEAAIDLAKITNHVTMVQFLDALTADKILVDALSRFDNVDILYEHEAVSINGDSAVESVTVRDRKSGEEDIIEADGIFIEIGLEPNTEMVKGLLEMNEYNEILVDSACLTSVPGIFAAGDVTTVPFKQIIIAGGEGSKAALAACEYLLRGAGVS